MSLTDAEFRILYEANINGGRLEWHAPNFGCLDGLLKGSSGYFPNSNDEYQIIMDAWDKIGRDTNWFRYSLAGKYLLTPAGRRVLEQSAQYQNIASTP